jgi:hypothetical protein
MGQCHGFRRIEMLQRHLQNVKRHFDFCGNRSEKVGRIHGDDKLFIVVQNGQSTVSLAYHGEPPAAVTVFDVVEVRLH